jgi:hypothetical protein
VQYCTWRVPQSVAAHLYPCLSDRPSETKSLVRPWRNADGTAPHNRREESEESDRRPASTARLRMKAVGGSSDRATDTMQSIVLRRQQRYLVCLSNRIQKIRCGCGLIANGAADASKRPLTVERTRVPRASRQKSARRSNQFDPDG